MQKLSKIHLTLIGALALAGCDNVGGSSENSQVRQNKLTISNTPVFPHSGNSDVYALLLSNHSDRELKLMGSKLNELQSEDSDSDDLKANLNKAQLAKANPISELVDLSACQTIAANSNCIVTVNLPKGVANGYFDFSLNYTDSHDKAYKVDKLIVFNAEMTPTDGMIMSKQYLESMVVNSDKYTVAIPFQLTDDFESIAIRQHGVSPSGYNQIICDSRQVGESADNSRGYAHSNSCTALIELNAHEANPELSLAATDTSGLERFVEIKSSVLYGNYPELIFTGSPVVLTNGSTKSVTIKNIGTQVAKDIQLTETGDTASFSITKTSCAGKSLENNATCFVQYKAQGSKDAANLIQSVSYKGDDGVDTRIFSGNFPVYLNRLANLRRPSISSVTPTSSTTEVFPEQLERFSIAFDQPINASSIYSPGTAPMGIVSGTSLGGCASYNYITATSISCTLTATALNAMIGDTSFGLNSGKFKNSVGNLLQTSPRYNYVVRHHRNPRVSYITNTSQTFKPDDTIKIKVDLDSSRYNSVANRYRFDAKSRYTITRNGCQTTNTNSCTIELDYKIPSAGQLTGSGTIRHTLPQQMLAISPTNGNKPSELLINHSLTVTVNKLPATHITVQQLKDDFMKRMFCVSQNKSSGVGFCSFDGLVKYFKSDYDRNYQWVFRTYNRFNGNSSWKTRCIPNDTGSVTSCHLNHDNYFFWSEVNGIRFAVFEFSSRQLYEFVDTMNKKPSPSQGAIDLGVADNPIAIGINDFSGAPVAYSKLGMPYYLVLIPKGKDIRTNPPGTIYVGRFCAQIGTNDPNQIGPQVDFSCKHLPPEQ